MYPDIGTDVKLETKGVYPKGCYVFAKTNSYYGIYFNQHTTGKQNEFSRQLCIKSGNLSKTGLKHHPITTIAHKYNVFRYLLLDKTKLGVYKGGGFYKVPVIGAMTSNNVKLACEKKNLATPCPAPTGCTQSDENCVTTSLNDCADPMKDLSIEICKEIDPGKCPNLDGVFSYMASWYSGSACGAEKGIFCAIGFRYFNKSALCAAREGTKLTLRHSYNLYLN